MKECAVKGNNCSYRMAYEAYSKYILGLLTDVDENDILFYISDSPEVSIIIPVYNQYNLTINCLMSIAKNVNADYEIIVVDDYSKDKTRFLEKTICGLKVIHNDTNMGYLKNCNKAVKMAKGKYVYLLNNDTQMIGDAISPLVEYMNKNDRVGAAGSKLITYSGKLQEAGCIIDKKGKTIPIGKGNNPLEAEYNIIKKVDYCSGASLMIRKELWDAINGFDEVYGMGYYEETDLCMQIKKKGYEVVYIPQSEVVHFVSKSFCEKRHKLINDNRKIFTKKWKRYL